MRRIFVGGESKGHTIAVADYEASVRVSFTAHVLGMTPNDAELFAQALMDAAERARMVETDAVTAAINEEEPP